MRTAVRQRFLPLFNISVAATVLKTIAEVRRYSTEQKRKGREIGLVPTMGYLHEGHASLIRAARERTEHVVASIFVNPSQFAPNEDFASYPRDLERDVLLAGQAGAAVIFAPDVPEIYPEDFGTSVVVRSVAEPFEGVSRPTHFEGVATVVAKLLHIAGADFAVFGRKDYQQCAVVRRMVRDLNIPTEIVVAPTVREADGLAMSSRNIYLAPDARQAATVLYRALQEGRKAVESGECRRTAIEQRMAAVIAGEQLATPDYTAAADADTLAQPDVFRPGQQVVLLLAVRIGRTRLIDNEVVALPQAANEG